MITRERILRAVQDEDWQDYRKSMKGLSTGVKLAWLRTYYDREHANPPAFFDLEVHQEQWKNCDVCIRIDNYIKALCRGGQLYAGESLETALMARPTFTGLRVKR